MAETDTSPSRMVGRPKSSPINSKRKQEELAFVVKNSITKKYKMMKNRASKAGTRCKPGTLKKIIESEKKKDGI